MPRLGLLPLVMVLAAGSALAGCGGPDRTQTAQPIARSLEGDAALIAAAQKISDAIGGCNRRADAEPAPSKVVGLEAGAIVLLGCTRTDFAYTQRLFAAQGNGSPVLLTLPDFGAGGWFATDQATMPELDAGAGVLTTSRLDPKVAGCGAEARYQWDGRRFTLQEMHWQDCAAPARAGPPFPVIWPAQQGAALQPGDQTPAP